MYCAIIGDIIGSKLINNRKETQKKLNEVLTSINEKYKNDIAAKFLITLGDEFQGLLKEPYNLLKILFTISMELYPIKIRFGIGFGEINTSINKEMAIGADGPAYYMARKAIEEIKDKEIRYEKPYHNIIINYNNLKYEKIIRLVNATLSICGLIEGRWSEKQREAIRLLNDKEKNLKNVASDLHVSKSSIHRRIDSSGYYTYRHAIDTVRELLLEIWGEQND